MSYFLSENCCAVNKQRNKANLVYRWENAGLVESADWDKLCTFPRCWKESGRISDDMMKLK